jgi:LmbE family N-acetylglucosaminyl deacetylase
MDALLEAALNEYPQGLHATHRDCMRAAVEAVVEAYEAAKPVAVGAVGWVNPADLDLLRAGRDDQTSIWSKPFPGAVPLSRLASLEAARSAEPVAFPVGWAFREGDMVGKKSGSWWEGKIVGWYSTRDTPRGYAIQAQVSGGNGPVQIFPETAIVSHPTPEASDV